MDCGPEAVWRGGRHALCSHGRWCNIAPAASFILTGFGVPPKKKLSQPAAPARPSAGVSAPRVLADDAAFAAALEALATLDAGFMERLDAVASRPALRRREPGFEGLAAIIVSQQVSTASANAIFAKVKTNFPTLDAAAIADAADEDLRVCGLSGPKQRTLRCIAAAVDAGTLDFDALARADADAAHATLCAVKGIGPWTADVFLLFCLGHADAFPAGDLALQEGAKLALDLAERPDAKALVALAERWRPLRGVAAHCLWAYYGAARRRAATLEDTPQPKPEPHKPNQQPKTPRRPTPQRTA